MYAHRQPFKGRPLNNFCFASQTSWVTIWRQQLCEFIFFICSYGISSSLLQNVGAIHQSLFIRPVNSLLFHWSPFIRTTKFTQNPVKSFGVQGHLLLQCKDVINLFVLFEQQRHVHCLDTNVICLLIILFRHGCCMFIGVVYTQKSCTRLLCLNNAS